MEYGNIPYMAKGNRWKKQILRIPSLKLDFFCRIFFLKKYHLFCGYIHDPLFYSSRIVQCHIWKHSEFNDHWEELGERKYVDKKKNKCFDTHIIITSE